MTIIYIYSKLRIYINPFVGLLTGCKITPTLVAINDAVHNSSVHKQS